MHDQAGSDVQTKVPGRPGAAIKTGGPVGGGMSQPATDGGASKNTVTDYLRSAPGKAAIQQPTKPAGGSKSSKSSAPAADDDKGGDDADYSY